jgi:hypothetical protein
MGDNLASLIYSSHGLKVWVPYCRGPQSANAGRNASERGAGQPSDLPWQPPPAQVTSDYEREGDAFLRTGERGMGSNLLCDAQQVPESSVVVATVSSFSLRESRPLPNKVST